jgi:hypothetical protein
MTELINISSIIIISGLAVLTIGIAAGSFRFIFRTMEFFLARQASHAKK